MLTNLKRKLRHNKYVWQYGLNFKPTIRYLFSSEKQEGGVEHVVNALNKNGIAFSSAEDLFEKNDLFKELKEAVTTLESEQKAIIEEARKKVNNPATDLGDKTFVQFLLEGNPQYDPESIWCKFANQKVLQEIANAYFGMKDAKMNYYNVWHSIPFQGEPRASQLWHRDNDDMQILKMFLYFNDVDINGGPIVYAPRTHLKGSIQENPEYRIESNYKRSSDAQMAKVVDSKNWITGLVKQWDVVFADTHGYHKGGHALKNDRLVYTCMYVSPACQRKMFS